MNAGGVGASSPGLLIHRRGKLTCVSCQFPVKALAVPPSFHISSSLIRRSRGRPPPQDQRSRQKRIYSDQNVEYTLDLDDISARASASIKRFYRASEAKVNRFIFSGADAFDDLKNSLRTERGNRIVFSCRRSSLQFFGNLLFSGSVVVLALLFALRLWSRRRWVFGGWAVTRRDRSLGGREVVVGRKNTIQKPEWRGFKGLVNPLSTVAAEEVRTSATLPKKPNNKQEKLPKWWSHSISSPAILYEKEEGQREANKLLKGGVFSPNFAIMDNRVSGKDYREDDFTQLRHICRSSGAKVAFETTNARDSFFRAAISFVLNICSRVKEPGAVVQIDGEEVHQFICGLAYNIGLDDFHAARLVCAAVAASTRSFFLQSWAFEVQGRRMEALEELLRLSQIFRFFPPEENSAELEMVAGILKNMLRLDQRTHLLALFCEVCSSDSRRFAAEALGLASNALV